MDLSRLVPDMKSVLDIGANIGDWTREAMSWWPDAHFMMIEANPGCEPFLEAVRGASYKIELLGSGYHPSKALWTLSPTSTGASVFRELSEPYETHGYTIHREQFELDDVLPRGEFDFIKIDTQGSELEILSGAERIREAAKAILLECSIIEYNDGAPLITEVFKQMIEYGFPHYAVVCQNSVYQLDVLFSRRELRLNE